MLVDKIAVASSVRNYNVYVGHSIFRAEFWLTKLQQTKILLITHPELLPGATQLKDLLKNNAFDINILLIPSGDENKNFATAQLIWQHLIDNNYNRDAQVIAFGGGMLCDVVGFAASIFMRGIAVIHIPTTLLAMVDAAVGGKTAINLTAGKNLLGTFYPPQFVVCDLNLLQTLPPKEYSAAIPEIVKYGLAFDMEFFIWVYNNIAAIREHNLAALQQIVKRCCEIKANIVSNDERDNNLRLLLNFGHTLGHALEKIMHYKNLSHGHAVGIGILFALHISQFPTKADTITKTKNILNQCNCPTTLPKGITLSKILDTINIDKKNLSSSWRWIVLEDVGNAKVVTKSPQSIHQALEEFTGVRKSEVAVS